MKLLKDIWVTYSEGGEYFKAQEAQKQLIEDTFNGKVTDAFGCIMLGCMKYDVVIATNGMRLMPWCTPWRVLTHKEIDGLNKLGERE